MKATTLRLGLSLAAASVIYPASAFAQATPPAAPAPAAPAAPAAAAPAPAPVEAAPAPAPMPAAEPAPAPAAAPADTAAPAAAAPAAAPADAPPPLPAVTGYIDGAFHMNISKNSAYVPAAYRSYDAAGGFILHAAHLAVSHSFSSEASAFVSLDFGSDATINNFNYAADQGAPMASTNTKGFSSGVPADVREGYLKWTPGDFTFQAGKFVTLNGIEVVDGPLNPTITRGFLYNLAEPVTHTGAKINYALGGGMAHIGAGLVNGWDRLYDNNNKKTFLFNADVAPSAAFHVQLSGSYGDEQTGVDKNGRLTLDLTGAVVLDALTLNFQGLFGSEPNSGAPNAAGNPQDDSWFGFGLQPVYTMDQFAIGGRIEFFDDAHGSRVGAPAIDKLSMINFTIAPAYTPTKNIQLRAEFRIDDALSASEPGGGTSKDVFNGKSSQITWALGAAYMF